MSTVVWVDITGVSPNAAPPAPSAVIRRALASLCTHDVRMVYTERSLRLLQRLADAPNKWTEVYRADVRSGKRGGFQAACTVDPTWEYRVESAVVRHSGSGIPESRDVAADYIGTIGWAVRTGVWIVPDERLPALDAWELANRSWCRVYRARSEDGAQAVASIMARLREEINEATRENTPQAAKRVKKLQRELSEIEVAVRDLPSLSEQTEVADGFMTLATAL